MLFDIVILYHHRHLHHHMSQVRTIVQKGVKKDTTYTMQSDLQSDSLCLFRLRLNRENLTQLLNML